MAKKNTNNDGRDKALEIALGDLKKRFGDGAIMRLGERNDQRLAQGRENAKTFLEANPELMFTIENKARETKGLPLLDSPVFAEALDEMQNQLL